MTISSLQPLKENTTKLVHHIAHLIYNFFLSLTGFGWVLFFLCFPLPVFLWLWKRFHSIVRKKEKIFWDNALNDIESEHIYRIHSDKMRTKNQN
jgi:hypothetical protein